MDEKQIVDAEEDTESSKSSRKSISHSQNSRHSSTRDRQHDSGGSKGDESPRTSSRKNSTSNRSSNHSRYSNHDRESDTENHRTEDKKDPEPDSDEETSSTDPEPHEAGDQAGEIRRTSDAPQSGSGPGIELSSIKKPKMNQATSKIALIPDDNSHRMSMTKAAGVGTIIVLFVLIGGLSLFLVWKSATNDSVADSLDKMSAELHASMRSIVHDLFLMPQITALLGRVATKTGEVPVTPNTMWNSTDLYFLEVLGQHNISAVFIGTEFGEFTGAFMKLETREMSIKSLSNITGGCQWQYQLNNEQTQRDTSKDILGENCDYEPTQRSWYIGAKESYTADGTMGGVWSDVYKFADGVTYGITFSVPLVENSTFVGVLAVDLTLQFLSTMLTQVQIPVDGVVYLANKDAEVLASSIIGGTSGQATKDPRIEATIEELKDTSAFDVDETLVVNNELIANKYLTSAEHLDGTPGIDLFAVTVFPSEVYLARVGTATSVSWVLAAVALLFAVLFAVLSYRQSGAPEKLFQGSEQRKKWKRLKRGLKASIFIIIILLLMIWLVWNLLTRDVTNELIDNLLVHTQNRLKLTTINHIKHPQQTISLMKSRYNRGQWDYETSNPAETYDSYLCGIMDSLRNSQGEFLVYGVYMGFKNGDNIGCFDRGYLALSVQDTSTNDCRERYLLTDDLARNLELRQAEHSSCDYDAKSRPWYTDAVEQTSEAGRRDDWVWSRPYTFTNDASVGITAMQVFWSGDRLEGVLAVDIILDKLSENLYTMQIGATLEDVGDSNLNVNGSRRQSIAKAAILEREVDEIKEDYNYIASSTLQVTQSFRDQNGLQFQDIVTASQTEDAEMRDTLDFLTQKADFEGSPSWENIENAVQIPRKLDEPLTFVIALQGPPAFGVNWISVLTVPRYEFWGQVNRNNRLALLVGVGATLLLLYLIEVCYEALKFNPEEESKDGNLMIEKLGNPKVTEEDVNDLLLAVEKCQVIQRSKTPHCEHLNIKMTATNIRQTTISGSCKCCDTRHMEHLQSLMQMKLCVSGFNNLAYAHLVNSGNTLAAKTRLYMMSFKYRLFMHAIVVAHICLSFAKPATPAQVLQDGFSGPILVFEGLFILLEFMDMAMGMWVIYVLRNFHSDDFLDESALEYVYALRISITFVIFIDYLLMLSIPFSIEYYLPMRELVLLFMNTTLRRAAVTFLRAVFKAKDVLLIYGCLIIVCATMSLVLFRCTSTEFEDGQCNPFTFENSFSNFVLSLITSFIYISTGENFADVVGDALAESKAYILFFAVLTIFGMFFIMALVAGFFESDFSAARAEENKLNTLLERTGIIAAFLILSDSQAKKEEEKDGGDGENVNVERLRCTHMKFNAFQRFCGTIETKKSADQIRPSTKMTAFDFLNRIESISTRRMILDRRKKQRNRTFDCPGTVDDLLRNHMTKQWWNHLVLAVVFSHIWVLTLYGTVAGEAVVDVLVGVLIIVQMLEILMRFGVFGRDYWYWAFYPQHWDPPFKYPEKNVTIHGHPLNGYPKFDDLEEAQEAAIKERLCSVVVLTDEDTFQLMSGTQMKYGGPNAVRVAWIKNPAETEAVQKTKAKEARMQMMSNRTEVILVSATFLAWAVSHIYFNSFVYPPGASGVRFITTFPILRVFTQVKRTRLVVFTLFGVLPKFTEMFVLLLIVFYIYAVYGTTNFSGKFNGIDPDGPPHANFEDLGNAVITLFQFLVGDSLDTMNAVVQVTSENSIFYFVTFTVIVIVLFANLFFGLILSTVSSLVEDEEEQEGVVRVEDVE